MAYGGTQYRAAEFRVNDYSAAPAPSWFSHRVELDAEACSGSIIMFGLERIESEEGPQMCRIVEMPPIATSQPFPEHVDLGRGAGGIVPCGGFLPDFDGDDCMAASKTSISGTPAGDVLLWGVRPGVRYVLTL
ncbi:MAG: hypothetical protein IJI37_06260, partial [Opitutales bacterium]|nr:hypothetical protein [Opitutales bacterium]